MSSVFFLIKEGWNHALKGVTFLPIQFIWDAVLGGGIVLINLMGKDSRNGYISYIPNPEVVESGNTNRPKPNIALPKNPRTFHKIEGFIVHIKSKL